MENFSRSARKITLTLFLAQSLASAGFITAATINSILGAKLGGSPSCAGVPTAVYLLGGAAAAYVSASALATRVYVNMVFTRMPTPRAYRVSGS